ncbi:MAG: DUF448 domain-containing protein [Anaerolinea sp.]|nr:DUF448 domain-containing protein [Anaerolinea sp.]
MARKAQKRIKHVPQRTCIGCRMVLSKRELIRIVRTPQGILIDPTGRADGRGAYLHNIRSCWEQAIKGPINNALKVELTAGDIAKLTEFMSTLPAGEPTQGSRTTESDQKGTA